MLTPRFKLTQDTDHVYISIHAPYTNISETEVDVDEENFLFVSTPYFLRLRLPGKILENDDSKGTYTCDSGDFNLTFSKVTPGEYFENLDMITSLLAPRDLPDVNPSLVEQLEESGITIEKENGEEGANKFTFGFACKISKEFHEVGSEFPQIFELRTPEYVSVDDRNSLREKYEDRKFSCDHYLADFFDDELLAPYLTATLNWDATEGDKHTFTEEEVAVLKELPNKHYIITEKEHKQVFLSLVDILFGYCYDKRTTLDDSTVESSWTINKLSATLSWFCVFNDMQKVLIACYRRAVVYPIFRNFDLCGKVKNDVVELLKQGKIFVIKCMIKIYNMFNLSADARYILNQLYIKDYLIFLQQCKTEEFVELSNNIANINITKNDLGLELEELEAAGAMVQKEDQIVENVMALQMAQMSLLPDLKRNIIRDGSDDDSDSSSDTSDDSSSDESSDDSSSSDLDSDDDPI